MTARVAALQPKEGGGLTSTVSEISLQQDPLCKISEKSSLDLISFHLPHAIGSASALLLSRTRQNSSSFS